MGKSAFKWRKCSAKKIAAMANRMIRSVEAIRKDAARVDACPNVSLSRMGESDVISRLGKSNRKYGIRQLRDAGRTSSRLQMALYNFALLSAIRVAVAVPDMACREGFRPLYRSAEPRYDAVDGLLRLGSLAAKRMSGRSMTNQEIVAQRLVRAKTATNRSQGEWKYL